MSEDFPAYKKIVWNAIKDCTKDLIHRNDYAFCSPVFKVKIAGINTKWSLDLFPSGFNRPFYMSLFLYREDDFNFQFNINFTFYIIGKLRKYAEISLQQSSNIFDGEKRYGAPRFLSHDKFAELFHELVLDGNLKIGCEISISKLDSKPLLSPSKSVLQSIQKMFDEDLFKDFELRCSDDQKLKCHRAILATQSPVFRAMLSNDMQEASQGFVEVPDFDSVVMNQVLRFMYGFPAGNLDKIAEKLIFAAEKYDLNDLKQKCIEDIIGKLSKDNVIQALLISDKISGCEKLFQKCFTVVVRNLSEITEKPAWRELTQEILTKILHSTAQMIPCLKTVHID